MAKGIVSSMDDMITVIEQETGKFMTLDTSLDVCEDFTLEENLADALSGIEEYFGKTFDNMDEIKEALIPVFKKVSKK